MDPAPLSGRMAVVTGASRNRGIGAAVCRALAGAGADICFTYWCAYDHTMPWGAEPAFPAELERELRSLGRRCLAFEVDLSEPAAPRRLFDAIEAGFGPVSILVNNATHSVDGGYEELDAAALDDHYAVNLRATALLSVEFARRFSAASGGRIISFSSGQSLGPMPDELAYAATKGALEAFSISLAAAVAQRGITVNVINPGPTDSGWMTDEVKDQVLPGFPQGRIGLPEDAARLVAFLAGDDARWITGQIIHSEGGFRR